MTRSPNIVTSLLFAFVATTQLLSQDERAFPDVTVAPGFEVELVYAVPKETQGSWVALTHDPKGRLIAADQYGSLYRITLPKDGSAEKANVERLKVRLDDPDSKYAKLNEESEQSSRNLPADATGAHGLLYAFDSLYIMVCEIPGKRGLWRLRDTNGDDQFDETKYLREMKGGGEHGPHSLALSPDGKSIYFANGNHTDLPTGLESSRPYRWGEDHLIPRMWDSRGHAKGVYAPGGYMGRTDPNGEHVELFAIGFRNQFDLAFDQNGELFTYDSDMEWDQGAPWYVPTRINHVVDAGDYGWRSGAGRWPAYYHDSLPATLDIGPGSPTGVTFGTGAKFPAKYQKAFFAADWTYGTLYAIHLIPDGASFRAEKEEFLYGKPLPLTDVIVNPHDGAMYYAVGGRRTESALYRVRYTGKENTSPAKPPAPTKLAKLRHQLETLHVPQPDPEQLDFIWENLGHGDRFIRFAARAALERQLVSNWVDRALEESDPQSAVEALTALARVGPKRYQEDIIDSLGRFEIEELPQDLYLPLMRAWQLCFTRLGKPDPKTCAKLAQDFDKDFPSDDPLVSRELAALLVYLDSPTVVAKTVPLLSVSEESVQTAEELGGNQLIARNDGYGSAVRNTANNRSDRQQIAYAYALRHATKGWTPELQLEYFSWFPTASKWKGGASFSGFIDNIRKDALDYVSDSQRRDELAKLSQPPAHSVVSDAVAPQGPGRDYDVDEAVELVEGNLKKRDFERGEAMYASTACIACHNFNGRGSGIGPDLSAAGNRYSVRDLLENIIEPSKVISDQYGSEQFELEDGSLLVGRVVGEHDNHLQIMVNPFQPNRPLWIPKNEVKSRQERPVSMMPPGLVNALNPDELRDLVAYLLSGGDPDDPMFR